MNPHLLIVVVLLAGCAPELPPAREQDVLDALVRQVVVPMGNVATVSRASDCRRTKAAVPPEAWVAFLAANGSDAAGLDLAAYSRKLLLDDSGASPGVIRVRRRLPVVALSRIGIAGDDALMCIEVFGAEDRGYYLQFHRERTGRWTPRAEFAAWSEAPEAWELAPEELPDGGVYEQ